MIASLFLVKLLTTVTLVLGLSWIAERVDTRLAGILSGMPLGSLLVLIFVGHDLGPEFAAESALYGIPALIGTLAFAGVYYLTSRTRHILGPLFGALAALPCYLLIAYTLRHFDFSLASGMLLTGISIVIAARLFFHIPEERVMKRVRLTFWHLCFRAGMAAFFVIIITEIAETVGPRWAGLLMGFPITFLPFLLIIHITYSYRHAHTVIRNFPVGLGGLVSYLALVNLTAVPLGINLSIMIGLLGSLAYLGVISYIFNRRRRASVEDLPETPH